MTRRKVLGKGLAACIVLMLVLVIFSGTASAAAPVYDDWEVAGDVSGWRRNTANTDIMQASPGGNPNGYLYSESTGPFGGGIFYAGAAAEKSELSGNFGFAPMIKISFDLNVFSTSQDVDRVDLRFRYHDAFYNGWRLLLTTSPTRDTWITYYVELDPTWTDADATAAGWIQESGSPSFSDTMADVYYTEIRLQGNAMIYCGIDNFRMNWHPTVDDINDYIQNLPDNCFKNNPENRKNAFENKLNAVQNMIDNGDYQGAIDKLLNDILDKVDKWITCPGAQQDLYDMINSLIAYLQSLLP